MGSVGADLSYDEPSPGPSQPGTSTSTAAGPSHRPPVKSKRGRKQDDNLPPSRSRDVQRAFRARRAERLAWLEARVEELEAENAELRARLGIGDGSLDAHSRPSTPSQLSPTMAEGLMGASAPSLPASSLPLPLPSAMGRPSVQSAPAWMPPAPIYLSHMHPRSESPASVDQRSQENVDRDVLPQFVDGLTGGRSYTASRGTSSAPPGPIPPDFVPSSVAWNILSPLSAAGRLDAGDSPDRSPGPLQLGELIRNLGPTLGQPPGSCVRQDGDRVLVSIAAVEHVLSQARQQPMQSPLPHQPHLPNYPYSFSQPLPSRPVPAASPIPQHMNMPSMPPLSRPQESMGTFGSLGGYEGGWPHPHTSGGEES